VLDFGLVRRIAIDPNLTAEHGVWGTPAYIAPESAAYARYDARSDIYSLGAVAYWLLTGKTVFEAAEWKRMIAGRSATFRCRLHCVTELAIPPELEAVMHGVSRERSRRAAAERGAARTLARCSQAAGVDAARAEAWWRAHHPEVLASAACPAKVRCTAPRARDRGGS